MNYIEKRKHQRLECNRDIAVFNAQNGTLIGHLENVSLGGMMLTSESPQAVGQEYDVNLSLKKEIDGKVTVRCRVSSAWSGESTWHEAESSKQYRIYYTGLKITSISSTELKTLRAVIEKLS